MNNKILDNQQIGKYTYKILTTDEKTIELEIGEEICQSCKGKGFKIREINIDIKERCCDCNGNKTIFWTQKIFEKPVQRYPGNNCFEYNFYTIIRLLEKMAYESEYDFRLTSMNLNTKETKTYTFRGII
jgi:hypothetical protein